MESVILYKVVFEQLCIDMIDYNNLGYFSELWCFLKMAITRKIEVGISSNFLYTQHKDISLYQKI